MSGARTLEVNDLIVEAGRDGARFAAVDGVTWGVAKGCSLGIVGESGSGKSLTLRAVMGLLPTGVTVTGGSVTVDGEIVPRAGLRRYRPDRRISLVFQDPLSALNPVMTIGDQVAEAPRRVIGMSRRASTARMLDLLGLVGIPDPVSRASAYPHQLSGGMRQRVMIAIALSCEPEILLCDEPTTSLDVTIQAQILALISSFQRDIGLATVFVTHDLGVARALCDDLAVMYAGRIVETGPTDEVLGAPRHPYTLALVNSAIDIDRPDRRPAAIPGTLPDPMHRPSGCSYRPRCRLATAECANGEINLRPVAPRRAAACIHSDEVGQDHSDEVNRD